jgi:hypothetical protein
MSANLNELSGLIDAELAAKVEAFKNRIQQTSLAAEYWQASASYYRSIILRQPPPLVPSRVRLIGENVSGFEEFDCECNRLGAVFLKTPNGPKGLFQTEFMPVAWRQNEA